MNPFPELPIVTPDPPRKTLIEKYGGLFYLGGGGLVVLLLLIGWFGYGLWSLRTVWADIYQLNNPALSDEARVAAARRLIEDPRVNQRQRWDLSLSRVPPDKARYLIAESMTSDLAAQDPRAYAIAVARSEDWPSWLRVLMARPLALAAGEGVVVDEASLVEMSEKKDPWVKLLAQYTLAVAPRTRDELRKAAIRDLESASNGPQGQFASELLRAMKSPQPRRADHLRTATRLLRNQLPDVASLGFARDDFTPDQAKPPSSP